MAWEAWRLWSGPQCMCMISVDWLTRGVKKKTALGYPGKKNAQASIVRKRTRIDGFIHHRKVLDEKSSSILGRAFDRAVRTFHPPVQ